MRVWTTKEKPVAELMAGELHPKFKVTVETFVNPSSQEAVYTVKSKNGQYLNHELDFSLFQ